MRLAIAFCLAPSLAHADPPKLPAHYAKLFELDRKITYDVTLTFWDVEKVEAMDKPGPSYRWPRKSTREVMTCKVARVAKLASVVAAELTCDKDYAPRIQIAGVYVASAAGLHGPWIDFPTTEADVADLGELAIPASPKPWRKDVRETDGRSYRGVKAEAGAWCVFDGLAGGAHGHDGDRKLCFGRGVISSGSHDFGPELRMHQFRAR